ncbi:MAG: hypothetical protein ABJC13_18000 [Acidobacteriota bacterium]
MDFNKLAFLVPLEVTLLAFAFGSLFVLKPKWRRLLWLVTILSFVGSALVAVLLVRAGIIEWVRTFVFQNQGALIPGAWITVGACAALLVFKLRQALARGRFPASSPTKSPLLSGTRDKPAPESQAPSSRATKPRAEQPAASEPEPVPEDLAPLLSGKPPFTHLLSLPDVVGKEVESELEGQKARWTGIYHAEMEDVVPGRRRLIILSDKEKFFASVAGDDPERRKARTGQLIIVEGTVDYIKIILKEASLVNARIVHLG